MHLRKLHMGGGGGGGGGGSGGMPPPPPEIFLDSRSSEMGSSAI